MPDNIEDLRKKLDDLLKKYQEISKKPLSIFNKEDLNNADKLNEAIGFAENALNNAQRNSSLLGKNIEGVLENFRDITKEATQYRDVVKTSANTFKKFGDISERILSDFKGYSNLSESDVKAQREKVEILRQKLKYQVDDLIAERAKLANSNENEEKLDIINKLIEEGQDFLKEDNALYKGLTENLDLIGNKLKKQNELLGLTGALSEGIQTVFSKLGFSNINSFLGINEALENAKQKAKEVATAELELNAIQLKRKELIEDERNVYGPIESIVNNIANLREQENVATGDNLKNIQEEINKKQEELNLQTQIWENTKNVNKEVINGLNADEKRLKLLNAQTNASTIMGGFFKDMGKNIVKNVKDPLAGTSSMISKITDGFLKLNTAQTEFARETGHTLKHWETITDSITTSSDYVKIATALTKQMGMDATTIFSKGTLTEAAELEQLMGLAGEEIGALARMAKLSGKEFKDQNTEIFKSVANFNKLNKTTISGKAILQDISKMSSTMTVNFKGNTTAMVEAASAAKKFGLELAQIDKIADSLLNFESSISAELEAELLTGKEFNLERARFLSLNNDIEGLTKEIVNNEQVRVAFASGNRLQQENVAKMLGMQKDEIAKMIIMDAQRRGLSDEAIARAAGMTENDFKRLSIQESINKSMEKMSEALAGPLQGLAELVSRGDALKGIFKAILAIMGGIAVIKIAGLVTQLTSAAVAAGSMAAGAAAWASGITLGLGILAVGAGIAYIMSQMDSAAESAKAKAATNAGDMFSTKGVTMVSTAEGGLFKTSPNDEMIVAPGISRMLGSTSPAPQDNSALIAEIRALRSEMSQKKQNIVVNVENKPVVGTQQIVAGLREQYKIE